MASSNTINDITTPTTLSSSSLFFWASNNSHNNNNNNNNSWLLPQQNYYHQEYQCNDDIVTTCYDVPYQEFTCTYPWLKRFYSSIEIFYDPTPMLYWMRNHPLVPIGACVLYGLFIMWGQSYFVHNQQTKKWNCRTSLATWNLFLCLFSMIGFVRTFPHLLHNMITLSIRDNICSPPTYGCGSTGVWILFFVLSKFPELFDTFFLVVQKKPVIFLHWYHHITVLLYCWHSYVTLSPTGIFFSVMNYFVHACMYGYYFIMSIPSSKKNKPTWLNPFLITILQISQMFVGIFVTILGFYYSRQQPPQIDDTFSATTCAVRTENNIAAFIMYGSYLLLFVQFFIERYNIKSSFKLFNHQKTTTTTVSASKTSSTKQKSL